MLAELLGTHAGDESDATGHVLGVELLDQRDDGLAVGFVADLDADGVGDAAEVLHVRAVRLPGALAAPEEVRAAPVVLLGGGVQTREPLLVPEVERLVRGEKVGGLHAGAVLVDPARRHERERGVNLIRQRPVLGAPLLILHKVEVPLGDALQRGVTAVGEGAEEVEGGAGLVVRLEKALGVRATRLRGKLGGVDVVAAVGGEGDAVDRLHVLGPGLGELTGHAAQLHDGHAGAVHEDDGHLEEDAVGVPHVVGAKLLKRLGAIAAKEHERVARGGVGELRLEGPGLAREHERGAVADLLEHSLELVLILVVGLLERIARLPRVEHPVLEGRARGGDLLVRGAVAEEHRVGLHGGDDGPVRGRREGRAGRVRDGPRAVANLRKPFADSRRVGTRAATGRDLGSRDAHLVVTARRARTEARAAPMEGLDALRLRDRADTAAMLDSCAERRRGNIGVRGLVVWPGGRPGCATTGRSKARDRLRDASNASRTP